MQDPDVELKRSTQVNHAESVARQPIVLMDGVVNESTGTASNRV